MGLDQRIKAMQATLDAMHGVYAWELVEVPYGVEAIHNKWDFKFKMMMEELKDSRGCLKDSEPEWWAKEFSRHMGESNLPKGLQEHQQDSQRGGNSFHLELDQMD